MYNQYKCCSQRTNIVVYSSFDDCKIVDTPTFLCRVLWTDKAVFASGVRNLHNLHVWATENLHATRHSSFQHRFSVNIWAGIVDDYVIQDCLGGAQYSDFPEETLPLLLENVPLHEHVVSTRRGPSPFCTLSAQLAWQQLFGQMDWAWRSDRLASTFSRTEPL
jgi:hypothetical protein